MCFTVELYCYTARTEIVEKSILAAVAGNSTRTNNRKVIRSNPIGSTRVFLGYTLLIITIN